MGDPLSFDLGLGDYLIYLTEKAISRIRRSKLDLDERKFLELLVRRSVERAGRIQIIGMAKPIRLSSLYQPTRLIEWRDREVSPEVLLEEGKNTIVLAGPGKGKTTLLHWCYVTSLERGLSYPFLVTLRRSEELDVLQRVADMARTGKLAQIAKKRSLLFLVDGYDEVPAEDRKRISKILQDLSDAGVGNFCLSCRLYYPLVDLSAETYQVAGFSRQDAQAFVTAFEKNYGGNFDPVTLIEELQQRGFADFLSHPLLLTLVCILKSSLFAELPRAPIALITRALDVLRLKWDYEKGILRETNFPIDGQDRIRALMRIAFHMKRLEEKEATVTYHAREFLKLVGHPRLDPQEFLMELAQWYGLLVPVEEMSWAFTHRTIHDYLAARYWVESGKFNPQRVAWDSRSAYAAALSHDATESLVWVLDRDGIIHVAAEILSNQPLFDVSRVAAAVTGYFRRTGEWALTRENGDVLAETQFDFFDVMSGEMLRSICLGSLIAKELADFDIFVLSYCLTELSQRDGRDFPEPPFWRNIKRSVRSVRLFKAVRAGGVISVDPEKLMG